MYLIKTPQALMAPHGCAHCGSAKFPILDTLSDISPLGLRIYLCRVHAKEAAIAYGFIKGDEMDDLMRVRDELVTNQQETAEVKERYEALRKDLTQVIDGYEAEMDAHKRTEQRAEQLQTQLEQMQESFSATLAATRPPEPEPEPDYEPALD